MRTKIGFALLALPLITAGCADKPGRSEQPTHSAHARDGSTMTPASDTPPAGQAATTLTADNVKRLAPKAVQAQVAEGALLVCAYDSDEKFAKMALEGAISRSSFEKQRASVAKDKLLIFYCA